jgi:hypothetical protein
MNLRDPERSSVYGEALKNRYFPVLFSILRKAVRMRRKNRKAERLPVVSGRQATYKMLTAYCRITQTGRQHLTMTVWQGPIL